MRDRSSKDVYREGMQAICDGEGSRLADSFDERVVDHNPLPGQPDGIEGFRYFMEYMHRGLARPSLTFEMVISEGDMVAARTTWHGVHHGPFLGVEEPTGRTVTIPTLHLVRVRGGRIIEMWGLADVDAAQAELARGR